RAPRYRDHDSDDDSEDGHSHKKSKSDASIYPWVVSRPVASPTARPVVGRLEEQYRNFARDIKSTLTDLLNTPSIPEFAISEWDNILRGKPVDHDQVFSGRYSTVSDEKQKHRIADGLELSISVPGSPPVEECSGDWVVAWQDASAAYAIALPDLAPICAAYNKQIISLFAALHISLAHRVLDYDRAVRKRVALNRDLLFTDTADFADLRLQFVDSGGANVLHASTVPGPSRRNPGPGRGGGSNSARRGSMSEEACRRFNFSIAHDAATCRYKHVCSACHSGGHPRPQCPLLWPAPHIRLRASARTRNGRLSIRSRSH
ncbi:uncharacterized protein BXZ73DRAFT_62653, partial [Epithele typhae]|uniref:uncharacterized protein n=1 Tax=Epithele typhae TaxID=378194 RepID=UPI00200746D9